MSAQNLTAYLHGARVGTFTRSDGEYAFTYDDGWAQSSGRMRLTLSMPKSERTHAGPAVSSFLWGLLPDNADTIARWAARFDVNRNNPLALLEHVGMDCAGALQLSRIDGETLSRDGGVDPVSGEDIVRHLHTLGDDGSDWILPARHAGHFSLGGAQPKFALTKVGDGWGVPWGNSATTHIVKPGVAGLSGQSIIEHLTMAAARTLGLNAARTTVEMFGGIPVIVVERYDRLTVDGTVTRLHQEDFCQALGVHPATKYQNEGGPGIIDAVRLLAEAMPAGKATAATNAFMEANAFNWLIEGTDAHAKNYSLLHTNGGSALAPLYDVASALPYLRTPGWTEKKLTVAMSVSKRYRILDIFRRQWEREAYNAGVDPDVFTDRIIGMADALPNALTAAAANLTDAGIHHDEIQRFVDAGAARAARVLNIMQPGSTPATKTIAPTMTQPRAGELGAATHRGRYGPKRPAEFDGTLD